MKDVSFGLVESVANGLVSFLKNVAFLLTAMVFNLLANLSILCGLILFNPLDVPGTKFRLNDNGMASTI